MVFEIAGLTNPPIGVPALVAHALLAEFVL
jgi:hypothetical protein